jgi:hypothetical protein
MPQCSWPPPVACRSRFRFRRCPIPAEYRRTSRPPTGRPSVEAVRLPLANRTRVQTRTPRFMPQVG